jgi:hypothetical protein
MIPTLKKFLLVASAFSRSCRFLWLVAFALILAQPLRAGPFFTPKSTLIILSGVPGDLESESSYRDQLRSCLEIAQANTNISRVVILSDNPESVGLPVSGRTTAIKADRAHFLELTNSLNTESNPLVLIAWGHGGRQGATNVFHVRGPRITTDDFSKVAASSRAPMSSWILYFRGSGVFASRLRAPNRRIISSDADSGFNSDPIGMSLLLKALRDQPDPEFESLAADLGKMTAAWYEEHHLGRVEEPTVWLSDAKPQLLASSAETSAFSSVSSSTPNPGPTNGPAHEIPAANTELPPSFKDLPRVSPGDFPEDDAVILRRSVSHTIAGSPALTTDHDDFIQILAPEGKRHADFDISYSPPGEDLSVLDCEVLSPRGKITRLNPDAIHESAEKELGDYRTARRKFLSLPGAVPGAILHLHYRTAWKEFPQPRVSLKIPLAGELPIVSSTIKITVPRDTTFHWGVEKIEAADPVIERTDYGVSYSWKFSTQPAESHDSLSPPNLTPRLMVSLFPDWSSFADWYARICRLADEVTPEIEKQAAELTTNAKDDREKILAIYNFVTGLRYVAVPLGVNSFRPQSAANVLSNHYGDCKDKANLFNALLRSIHVPADLVLVPRFSQAYAAVPGFAFNHAISRVSLSGEDLWVDTTDDTCRFGMLPPGDYGRNVLVIAAGTNQLIQLPSARAQDHRIKIECQINVTNEPASGSPADSAPGFACTWNATATGFPDYALRASARANKARHESLPLLENQFRLGNGTFALEHQSHTSVADLDEDFAWRAQGRVLGIASRSGGRLFLRAPVWLPRDWQVALHRRRDPLFLNEGYPLTLDEQFEFAPAVPNQSIELPKARESSDGPLHWRLSWTNSPAGHLLCALHAELPTGEIPVADTEKFQRQIRALLAALAEPAKN